MSIQHKNIDNDNLHDPKDFSTAANSTVLSKDADGNLEWVSKDDVGGSQGPQGIQGPAYSEDNLIIVQKDPQPGQYSSIVTALASISDNSSTNRYLIRVGPGVYDETATINMKSYVSIEGSGMGSTVINGNFTGGHLVRASDFSSITKLTLTFPDTTRTGYALVYHENTVSAAGNRSFTIKQVHFGFSDILVKSYATTLTCQVNVQDCNYGSIYTFNYGFVAQCTASVAARIIIQGIRPVQVATPRPLCLFLTDGPAAELVASDALANSGGNALSGHTYGAGTLGKYGLWLKNGGTGRLISGTLRGWEIAVWSENSGTGPQIDIQGLYSDRNIETIRVDHPDTRGAIMAQIEQDKVTVDPSVTDLTVFFSDISAGDQGIVNVGKMITGESLDDAFDLAYIGQRQAECGIVDGGVMSIDTATTIDITAGRGYFRESSSPHVLREVMWDAQSLNVDPGNVGVDVYIAMDETGVAFTTASIPNTQDQIVFGRVVTTGTNSILILEAARVNADHAANRNLNFLRQSLGAVYESGSTVSENGVSAHNLDVGPGFYWFGNNRFTPSGGSQISFYQHHRSASGSGPTAWVRSLTQVVNNSQYDDGSGTLQALPATKFIAHELYIYGCTGGVNERYFLQIGQESFATQEEAEGADVPTPPTYFKDATIRIARIVVQQGASNIVSITATKPTLGGSAAGGGAAASDHGSLTGLTDDDHAQYILVSGARAFTGNISIGGNNITSVGTVDGVDVSTHASRHLPNGADPLTTAAASSISVTNAEGTANSMARSDHTHKVTLAHLGGTEMTIQDLQNKNHSAGVLTGMTLSDGGSGTVNVAAGEVLIRSSNSSTAQLIFYAYAGSSGNALTNNSQNYLYIDYNAGSPQLQITTTKSTDYNTKAFLGNIYRDGTILHIASAESLTVSDHASKMHRNMTETMGYQRIMNGGAVLSETGTRNFIITAGTFWNGLNRFSTPSINTAGSDTFTAFYRDGIGGWLTVASQTQINNTQYDNNSGTLASLTAGYYGVHWVYMEQDSDVSVIFGQDNYATLGAAREAAIPTSVPPQLTGHSILVGKIIIQQAAGSFTDTLSAFTDDLEGTSAGDHGTLTGLSDDDHPQYLLVNGSRAMTGALNMGSQNITSVGTVDGVTVSAHASRHLPGGADALATAAPVATGVANSEGAAASFSRSDHVHNTVISNSQVSDNAAFATTSGTDTVLTGMTITPGAGTYLAMFSGNVSSSTNNADGTASIYVNGVQQTNSERTKRLESAASNHFVSTQFIVTPSAGQAVDVRVRTTAGTMTFTHRALILVRLG